MIAEMGLACTGTERLSGPITTIRSRCKWRAVSVLQFLLIARLGEPPVGEDVEANQLLERRSHAPS